MSSKNIRYPGSLIARWVRIQLNHWVKERRSRSPSEPSRIFKFMAKYDGPILAGFFLAWIAKLAVDIYVGERFEEGSRHAQIVDQLADSCLLSHEKLQQIKDTHSVYLTAATLSMQHVAEQKELLQLQEEYDRLCKALQPHQLDCIKQESIRLEERQEEEILGDEAQSQKQEIAVRKQDMRHVWLIGRAFAALKRQFFPSQSNSDGQNLKVWHAENNQSLQHHLEMVRCATAKVRELEAVYDEEIKMQEVRLKTLEFWKQFSPRVLMLDFSFDSNSRFRVWMPNWLADSGEF